MGIVMSKVFLCLMIVSSLLVACGQQAESPSEVYLDYHARSAQGMSFEEDASFYSSSKVSEVADKLAVLVAQSGRTRDEAIRLYLDISRDTARCSKLNLTEEKIEGGIAYLVFDATGTCGAEFAAGSQHKVTLVLENGWKLDDVEIVL